MSKRVGIVLSGCGVKDGSEIHEAVITLLHVDKNGATPVFLAPNIDQQDVIDHLKQTPQNEKRNVLAESARIARGNIKPLENFDIREIDAVIFPGGFGAAKNLCTYAKDGRNLKVLAPVEKLIKEVHKAKKTIGDICIAPVLVAKVLGPDFKVKVTIGNDPSVAKDIESFGAKHENARVDEIVVDEINKVVTTPAYMLAQRISEVEAGISKLVKKVLELS